MYTIAKSLRLVASSLMTLSFEICNLDCKLFGIFFDKSVQLCFEERVWSLPPLDKVAQTRASRQMHRRKCIEENSLKKIH